MAWTAPSSLTSVTWWNTIEGKVLDRLLSKLQDIRDTLDDDAVFNVIGEILPATQPGFSKESIFETRLVIATRKRLKFKKRPVSIGQDVKQHTKQKATQGKATTEHPEKTLRNHGATAPHFTLIGVAPSLQSRLLPCYGVDMSIALDTAKRYPADWRLRSRLIFEYRAAGQCEWCGAINYEPHPDTGNVVILTIAHVFDKQPEVANLLNLPALCQRCHLNWDRKEHKFNRIRNRMAKPIHHGQIPLCLPPEDSLAMLVYDQLVRRGEVSMPPRRVDAAGLRSRVLRVDRSALRMTHSCRRCWRCRCDCRR